MKFNQLNLKSKKNQTRVGRGISAGKGKTAGRGTKGQGARKSGGVRPGFEGGQMPLYMRIPKLRGFTSHRIPPTNVYTGQLDGLGKAVVDSKVLAEAGFASSPYERIKLINKGAITKKLTVKLPSASTSAIAAIEKSGGSFEKVDRLKRSAKKTQEQG